MNDREELARLRELIDAEMEAHYQRDAKAGKRLMWRMNAHARKDSGELPFPDVEPPEPVPPYDPQGLGRTMLDMTRRFTSPKSITAWELARQRKAFWGEKDAKSRAHWAVVNRINVRRRDAAHRLRVIEGRAPETLDEAMAENQRLEIEALKAAARAARRSHNLWSGSTEGAFMALILGGAMFGTSFELILPVSVPAPGKIDALLVQQSGKDRSQFAGLDEVPRGDTYATLRQTGTGNIYIREW